MRSLTVQGDQVIGLVRMSAEIVPSPISEQSNGVNLNIDAPFVKYMKLVRSETDCERLDFETKKKFGAFFALLPSFLAKVAIESAYHFPTVSFTEFMVAMVVFDRKKLVAGESTWVVSGNILQDLWVVSKGLIQDTIFETIDNEKAGIW